MNNSKEIHKLSLWDNPAVKAAYKALTPSQLREYKRMGEYMYNNNNNYLQENDTIDNLLPPIEESAAYIIEGLKSGLHPSCLDDDEKNIMIDSYGKEWYKKWDEDWDGISEI